MSFLRRPRVLKGTLLLYKNDLDAAYLNYLCVCVCVLMTTSLGSAWGISYDHLRFKKSILTSLGTWQILVHLPLECVLASPALWSNTSVGKICTTRSIPVIIRHVSLFINFSELWELQSHCCQSQVPPGLVPQHMGLLPAHRSGKICPYRWARVCIYIGLMT